MTYDYIITLPTPPVFSKNLESMFVLMVKDGGHSPTLKRNTTEFGVHTSFSYNPMIGTVEDAGTMLFHFRLLEKKGNAELITYLQSVMTNPFPPISVVSVRSRDRTVSKGTIEAPIKEREKVVDITKADIFRFFEVPTFDGEGQNTGTRPATITDTISFSRYGSIPYIEV